MKNMKMVDAIREALREEMLRDEDVFLLGEALGGVQGGSVGPQYPRCGLRPRDACTQ